MKLSQIKTKEVRDRVRKSRYKKFIFAFIVLFLILIVSVLSFILRSAKGEKKCHCKGTAENGK